MGDMPVYNIIYDPYRSVKNISLLGFGDFSSPACSCLGRARPYDVAGLLRTVGWTFHTTALMDPE